MKSRDKEEKLCTASRELEQSSRAPCAVDVPDVTHTDSARTIAASDARGAFGIQFFPPLAFTPPLCFLILSFFSMYLSFTLTSDLLFLFFLFCVFYVQPV